MLGSSPSWDQMQNSKNALLHAKIQCWTRFVLLNYLISLHIVLVSLTKNIMKTKHFSMKFIWELTPSLQMGKGGGLSDLVLWDRVCSWWKINYRFLKAIKTDLMFSVAFRSYIHQLLWYVMSCCVHCYGWGLSAVWDKPSVMKHSGRCTVCLDHTIILQRQRRCDISDKGLSNGN